MKFKLLLIVLLSALIIVAGCGLTPGKSIAGQATGRGGYDGGDRDVSFEDNSPSIEELQQPRIAKKSAADKMLSTIDLGDGNSCVDVWYKLQDDGTIDGPFEGCVDFEGDEWCATKTVLKDGKKMYIAGEKEGTQWKSCKCYADSDCASEQYCKGAVIAANPVYSKKGSCVAKPYTIICEGTVGNLFSSGGLYNPNSGEFEKKYDNSPTIGYCYESGCKEGIGCCFQDVQTSSCDESMVIDVGTNICDGSPVTKKTECGKGYGCISVSTKGWSKYQLDLTGSQQVLSTSSKAECATCGNFVCEIVSGAYGSGGVGYQNITPKSCDNLDYKSIVWKEVGKVTQGCI